MAFSPTIFFGAGPGRCGTMTLANLLNAEKNVVCTHEGKIRQGTVSGEQWLPFMTMENYIAYASPDQAEDIFRKKRGQMTDIAARENLAGFGDIAYNNVPFIKSIPAVFPSARLIVMVRDGRDFVRSVYTSQRPDPTPVGWLDEDVELTPLEQYIAYGRLRPADAEGPGSRWAQMTAFEKNAWLWAETMRLIADGLEVWERDKVIVIRFEEFFKNTLENYKAVRSFLGLDTHPVPEEVKRLADAPINKRGANYKLVPHWKDWPPGMTEKFMNQAEDMMKRWNYL